MTIQLDVCLTENKATIQFQEQQGTIIIQEIDRSPLLEQVTGLHFFTKNKTIISITQTIEQDSSKPADAEQLITITSPWDIELDYLEQLFIDEAENNGLTLVNGKTQKKKIPENHLKTAADYKEKLLIVLHRFGYSFKPQEIPAEPKAKPAKARHRWTKEVSQIAFTVNTRESTGTVYWQKRNELLLKAGATMMKTPPLNKDGSLGFAAKMGQKIRDDHKDKFNDFVTTEDLILKSVNELGLFLYFGGTNSWLELIDEHGKSLNEWTVVE